MATDKERIEALKVKVRHALELVDWLCASINQADRDHEEENKAIENTQGWKELSDAIYNGFLASYSEEFKFRDMSDPELFPEEFNKAA